METAMEDWSAWIGRKQRSEAVIRPEVTEAMAATLDLEKAPAVGDPLPPGWHWLFFNVPARARELDIDGHPKRGGFLPPIQLPRRMWAGGRLNIHAALPVGEKADKESEILKVETKQGRQGTLVFITIRHRLSVGGELAIDEEQDIVYRDRPVAAAREAAITAPSPDLEWSEQRATDPVLLFRYSALTFNAHRIHYDAEFATKVEGYDGLLVHGPLLATLLMQAAYSRGAPRQLRRFEYRGLRPLVVGRTLKIGGRKEVRTMQLWAISEGDAQIMSASAEFA